MAYEIDPEIQVFSVDTGRLPAETLELADRAARALPGSRPRADLRPTPSEVDAMTGKHGVDLFKTAVDLRLLCCNVRKVRPLTQAPAHARRLGHRPAPRPVGEPHEHPQGRDRPRPRRDRQAEPARRVDARTRSGTTCASARCPTTRSTTGLHLDRLRAVHARDRRRTSRAAPGRWWWESNAPKECGIHCSIESGGLEHELHALIGEDMCS